MNNPEKNPPQPSLIRAGEKQNQKYFKFIPYNKKLVSRARELRLNMTGTEKVFWFKILKNATLSKIKFTRQKPLGEFIADFYCSELGLVIEIDGDIHKYSNARDSERTYELQQKYNLKVIRYLNRDITENTDKVYNTLLKEIIKRKEELRNPPDKGDLGGFNAS